MLDRTASVTALYIDSFVAPQVEGIVDVRDAARRERRRPRPPPVEHAARRADRVVPGLDDRWRDRLLAEPRADRATVRAGGRASHSAMARGSSSTDISDLSGPENAYERERWSRLVETYVPVRERGGPRIIGVTEFYQLPDEIDAEVASARLGVVDHPGARRARLLPAPGRDREAAAVTRSIGSNDPCAIGSPSCRDCSTRTHRPPRSAPAARPSEPPRSTRAVSRRIGSDLHDGPAQTMALALLRLDELDGAAAVSEAGRERPRRPSLDRRRTPLAGVRRPAARGRGRSAPSASTSAARARPSR